MLNQVREERSGAEWDGECHGPKQTHPGRSLSKQELVLLYQSFVYIGLRKEVGIFGEVR